MDQREVDARSALEVERLQRHAPVASEVESVWFGVGKAPSKSGGGEYAQVKPKEIFSTTAFLRRLCEHNPGMSERTARFYLDAICEELTELLREGRFVTLNGFMQIGVSLRGVEEKLPESRQVNRRHLLRPWVRFARPFITALNRTAHVQNIVERVTVEGERI